MNPYESPQTEVRILNNNWLSESPRLPIWLFFYEFVAISTTIILASVYSPRISELQAWLVLASGAALFLAPIGLYRFFKGKTQNWKTKLCVVIYSVIACVFLSCMGGFLRH